MKKVLLFIFCWFLLTSTVAQNISQKIQKVYKEFEADSQLSHAISSLYVINAKTGAVVFDKNSQIGLAPASTQKIITAATAFELLGKDFRYKTEFGTRTDPGKDLWLWINPSGDPTFGSWRWESTQEKKVLNEIIDGLKQIDFKNCMGIFMKGWDSEQIPDGWIWQDIGNYYGAGSAILNWRENQYDLFLKSGDKIGDPVAVVGTAHLSKSIKILSRATSAAKGSGDNAYIYQSNDGGNLIVRGTIPVNEDNFKISGSITDPIREFVVLLSDSLKGRYKWNSHAQMLTVFESSFRSPSINITHYSPPLDSIIYWFLQKSINLYGEALIKTFAYEKQGFGSTDSGATIVKKFWKQNGLDEDELNIYDGSGLSPLNRVTTHAQVEILKYAKSKSWFPLFNEALPIYNGMKMKSGTISDVKGFCGYHKASDGNEYIFSFLVNNYNGRSSAIVAKMYKVLDVLK
ncbi:MAG: D-alanyl-D-alanine carboxypeptidase/D-alanyl-D-alanine-endopeptidase [Chitinophagales bacterium]